MIAYKYFCKIIIYLVVLFTSINLHATLYIFNKEKIGGNFQLIIYSTLQKEVVDKKVDEAYNLVDSLNIVLSNYLHTSEINQLNINHKLKYPSTHLLSVLKASQEAFKLTNGYFDISIQPLESFWNEVETNQKLPLINDLEKQRKFVGLNKVLKVYKNKIICLNKNSKLELGGIAKGYIIDQVYEFLKANNVESFLVEAAGDIRVFGAPENKESWTVGVSSNNKTNKFVQLTSGQAIATSGKTYRYRTIEGVKYSHIINPKTLTPVTHSNTSSVIAENAVTADYLASAFNIISNETEINQVLNNFKNVDLLLFNNAGIVYATQFFKLNKNK